MTLGFVTRRRLRREITELGQAYRRDIEEARRDLRRSEQRFADLVHATHVDRSFDGTVSILIRLEPIYTQQPDHEFAESLARTLAERLFGLHSDWRREALTGKVLDLRDVS